MRPIRIPTRLIARLGSDESQDLAALLQEVTATVRDDLVTFTGERFGQALVVETAKLRVEFRDQLAALRVEFRDQLAALRVEFRDQLAGVRVEFRDQLAGFKAEYQGELADLRSEMRREQMQTRSAFREEMAGLRVEVLRWSFLFWLGQTATIFGVLAYLR
jgi:hypothetical protein